ncbi:GNAT family N-acetyltransferase [Pigmentiphaga aceris]|uniref:GNAT family N-acetyltransferase n=1 Tax=Pigmentiphaga aceris TaxID=1940612 RepID=A0A5C0AXS5_9BURK|nr:GNAT family N-acetyltransferase [Pigmentiphaga aceris]QEI06233.1 GNAT family N-acetyltransferase [Pigmentiphaga aceris]
MPFITVRQAVLCDLDACAVLFDEYRQFQGRESDLPAARAFIRARVDHGESVIFLAYEGDTPLGFTQLYPIFSSVSMARVFILNDLFVREAGRRKGVASHLLNAAEAYARELGAVRLSLVAAVDNVSAHQLYESRGWKPDQQFVAYHQALQS